MSGPTDERRLDALLEIADERPCPLSDWEVEFLTSLDGRTPRGPYSEKQQEIFDRLVEKHLR